MVLLLFLSIIMGLSARAGARSIVQDSSTLLLYSNGWSVEDNPGDSSGTQRQTDVPGATVTLANFTGELKVHLTTEMQATDRPICARVRYRRLWLDEIRRGKLHYDYNRHGDNDGLLMQGRYFGLDLPNRALLCQPAQRECNAQRSHHAHRYGREMAGRRLLHVSGRS